MAEPILSYELKSLINKIKQQYIVEFPIQVITPNYLLLAILEEKSCDGYSVVTKLMMDSTIDEFKQYIIDRIMIDASSSIVQNGNPTFSDVYDTLAEEIANSGVSLVTSSLMFNEIVKHDNELIKKLTSFGVTPDQINDTVIAYNTTANIGNKEIKANKWNKKKPKETKSDVSLITSEKLEQLLQQVEQGKDVKISRPIPNENNVVEANCKNLVRIASTGAYDSLIGYEDVITKIFDVFGKYERNAVAIVGGSGVGKTSIVQLLARYLYEQKCPKQFKDKYLMQFGDTITSVILKEMARSGKYVAFIDKMENMFANKENEANNYMFLTELFNAQNIYTIITMNDSAYAKYVKSKPEFDRFITKIDIQEPDDKLLFNIVKSKSAIYEEYNKVNFNDDCINEGIRLAKRFISNEHCPSSALNILDTVGSYVKMREPENVEVTKLKQRLNEIEIEKNSIQNSSSAEEFDKKDALIREAMEIDKKINSIESKNEKSKKKLDIKISDMRSAVAEMLNLPISEMDDNEKVKLKKLSDNLSSVVIGQDEAISDITRAVKRQRVGLANPNKPIVMLFVGTTGCGKSFLAKRLAYEMFGDEKNMVRLDMSEYSDKTSAAKLYGTSPGYVGYDDGGVLTEAIKKNGHCVLLLDEIEKADDEVFNVFLQVFDEGRLSDNKGTVVDFKNVIIIMTSNVGAKDVSEKRNQIGFGSHDEESRDREIIKNSIKHTFKPEFINRIDNICYFNKLTDDNLRQIIINEVKKVKKKINDIGYDMDDEMCNGKLIDSIFEKVKTESEYGARPILREIQFQLEDKLTDYIIDNEIKPGFVFKYNDIYREEKEENE